MHKYDLISKDIRKKIVEGDYPINSQLPFEKDIMEQYNVSRITAKRAYDILVEEGLVVKIRGKGTFVKNMDDRSALLFMRTRQFMGFSSNNKNQEIDTTVVSFNVELPQPDICDRLKINKNDWVYHFTRVRHRDQDPVVIEYTTMPMALIPNLTQEIAEASIYAYVEGELGFKIKSAHRIITSRMPYDTEKELLNIGDIPVVNVEEITYLDNGSPFSYTLNVHSSEHFSYVSIANR